jgi:hypothetical protein
LEYQPFGSLKKLVYQVAGIDRTNSQLQFYRNSTCMRSCVLVALLSISSTLTAQYALGEFQAGYGIQIGGSLETKHSNTNGFDAADFKPSKGLYIGYNHFLNRTFGVGVTYISLDGTLEQSSTISPSPPVNFHGVWWNASGIVFHLQFSSSRFNPIAVYGAVRHSRHIIKSQSFVEIFDVSSNQIKANATTLGVGINWKISPVVALNLVEFSLGGGGTEAGGYDGNFIALGYLKTGINIRVMKK